MDKTAANLLFMVETMFGSYVRQLFGEKTKISVGETPDAYIVNINIDKDLIKKAINPKGISGAPGKR